MHKKRNFLPVILVSAAVSTVVSISLTAQIQDLGDGLRILPNDPSSSPLHSMDDAANHQGTYPQSFWNSITTDNTEGEKGIQIFSLPDDTPPRENTVETSEYFYDFEDLLQPIPRSNESYGNIDTPETREMYRQSPEVHNIDNQQWREQQPLIPQDQNTAKDTISKMNLREELDIDPSMIVWPKTTNDDAWNSSAIDPPIQRTEQPILPESPAEAAPLPPTDSQDSFLDDIFTNTYIAPMVDHSQEPIEYIELQEPHTEASEETRDSSIVGTHTAAEAEPPPPPPPSLTHAETTKEPPSTIEKIGFIIVSFFQSFFGW